jgi:hypothetical protein
MVDWIIGILEAIASPVFKWIRNKGEAKRRRLHIFVLKAIGRTGGIVAPDLTGHRFDLASIDRLLLIAQLNEALGGDQRIEEIMVLFEDPDTKEYHRKWKQQVKLGLPGRRDADRMQKLEQILHDMTEAGKLRFHPPNMWSVL